MTIFKDNSIQIDIADKQIYDSNSSQIILDVKNYDGQPRYSFLWTIFSRSLFVWHDGLDNYIYVRTPTYGKKLELFVPDEITFARLKQVQQNLRTTTVKT